MAGGKESPLWALGWVVAGQFGQIPVGMGLRGWEKGRWVAARCTDVQGPANRRPATSAMVWVWAGLGLRIRFEVCARGCAFFLCWPLEHGRPRELHESIYTAKSTARKGARCQVLPGAHRCLLPAVRPLLTS
jgi:hypothetical protein